MACRSHRAPKATVCKSLLVPNARACKSPLALAAFKNPLERSAWAYKSHRVQGVAS